MPCLFKSTTDTLETELLYGRTNTARIPDEGTSHTQHDSFFLSDRDKGISASMAKYFPNHHGANCSRHIQSNVKQWYGIVASKPVIQLSKTFSTKQEDYLFTLIGTANKKAEQYLKNIEPKLWRGTAQARIGSIPPRYGMTTSNAAECTNSVSLELRNQQPWLSIIEGMVDYMASNISKRRKQYRGKNPEEVLPWIREVLEKRWKASKAMEIIEIEEGKNEFAVTEYFNKFVEDDNNRDEDIPNRVLFDTNKKTRHVLHPLATTCTCGLWQDMRIPCRHAMVYFGKWNGFDFEKILRDHVHYYFKYKSMQVLYKPNICPVVTDTVEFDGKTQPPIEKKAAGRPKKKRFRRRSKYVDSKKSPIKCSVCGERGHNAKTCRQKDTERASRMIPEENEQEQNNNNIQEGETSNSSSLPPRTDLQESNNDASEYGTTNSSSQATTINGEQQPRNLKNDSDYD